MANSHGLRALGSDAALKQPRSRCCRRRRSSSAIKVKLPELPLVLAGVFGGPFVIFLFTPMRNALSLAAADQESSALEIYEATFPDKLASGWVGGVSSAIAACPEFVAMGPLFHLMKDTIGSTTFAVCMSGVFESTITYGAQTRNAQMAYNQEMAYAGNSERIELANPFVPWGPGICIQFLRNVVALSGIRVLSPICQSCLARVKAPQAAKALFGDIIAMLGAACMTAPLNQLYNFAVTSPTYREAAGPAGWFKEALGFLDRSYLLRDNTGAFYGLTPTLGRDLFLRCMYVANLYLCFSLIERVCVAAGKIVTPKVKS